MPYGKSRWKNKHVLHNWYRIYQIKHYIIHKLLLIPLSLYRIPQQFTLIYDPELSYPKHFCSYKTHTAYCSHMFILSFYFSLIRFFTRSPTRSFTRSFTRWTLITHHGLTTQFSTVFSILCMGYCSRSQLFLVFTISKICNGMTIKNAARCFGVRKPLILYVREIHRVYIDFSIIL